MEKQQHLATLVDILTLMVYSRKVTTVFNNPQSLMSEFLHITIEGQILDQASSDEIGSPASTIMFSVSSPPSFALIKNGHIVYWLTAHTGMMLYSEVLSLLNLNLGLNQQVVLIPWILDITILLTQQLLISKSQSETGNAKWILLILHSIAHVFSICTRIRDKIPEVQQMLKVLSKMEYALLNWLEVWAKDQTSCLVSVMISHSTSWIAEALRRSPQSSVLDHSNSDLIKDMCLITNSSNALFCLIKNWSTDHEAAHVLETADIASFTMTHRGHPYYAQDRRSVRKLAFISTQTTPSLCRGRTPEKWRSSCIVSQKTARKEHDGSTSSSAGMIFASRL